MVAFVFRGRNRIVAGLGWYDMLPFPLGFLILAIHRRAEHVQVGLEGNGTVGPGVG